MIYIFIIFLLIFIDLFSKNYINKNFKLGQKKSVYKDKIYIYHIKNKGLAYGFLKNSKNIIYILVFLALIGLLLLFYLIFKDGSKLKKIAYSFALGGALGNFIDRIKNKEVTDFIYLKYKNSPIFNFADIFLLISVILLFTEEIKNI